MTAPKATSIIILIATACVSSLVGFYVGTVNGIEIHAVEESKLAELALSEPEGVKLSPQLKEYLKGRLYWNSAIHMGDGYVSGLLKDYGPLDSNALEGVIYAKEPTIGDSAIREAALRKIKR